MKRAAIIEAMALALATKWKMPIERLDMDGLKSDMEAAYAAIEAAGMKLVSKELSATQVSVGSRKARAEGFSGDSYLLAREVYRVMFAAAEPTP